MRLAAEQVSSETKMRQEELRGLLHELAKPCLDVGAILQRCLEARDGRVSLLSYLNDGAPEAAGRKLLAQQDSTVKTQISLISGAVVRLFSAEAHAPATQNQELKGAAIGAVIGLGGGFLLEAAANVIHPSAGVASRAIFTIGGPALIGTGLGWGAAAGHIHGGKGHIGWGEQGVTFDFGHPPIASRDTVIDDLRRGLDAEKQKQWTLSAAPLTGPGLKAKPPDKLVTGQAAEVSLPFETARFAATTKKGATKQLKTRAKS